MLRPAHLLDIVRNFTLFMPIEGRKVKIVGRYQQYPGGAAVHRAADHREDADRRRRVRSPRRHRLAYAGLWQEPHDGFPIRKMRTLVELRRFKVVVVTDRTDLQRQLSETAALTGETVDVGKSVAKVKELLARPGLVWSSR